MFQQTFASLKQHHDQHAQVNNFWKVSFLPLFCTGQKGASSWDDFP